MSEPTKKSSPFPIAKATDQPEALRAERPLSPMRKLALPIGVAAALVLAGASAGVYAYAASNKTARDPARVDEQQTTEGPRPGANEVAVAEPLDPSSAPRLAGTSAPAPSQTPPTPTPPTPIPPNPNPPMPPGKPPSPHPTPGAIAPTPNHPKLGGKPMMTHSI